MLRFGQRDGTFQLQQIPSSFSPNASFFFMDSATCQGRRSSSGGKCRGADERKKPEEQRFHASETGDEYFNDERDGTFQPQQIPSSFSPNASFFFMDSATCQGRRSSSAGKNRGADERKKPEEQRFHGSETGDEYFNDDSGYSTPRAPRFRIPEKLPCPPAPKKRRLTGPAHCGGRRPASAVAFFTHPDMELFFLLAGRSGS